MKTVWTLTEWAPTKIQKSGCRLLRGTQMFLSPRGVRLEASHDRDPRTTCRRDPTHDIEMMSDFELRRGPHLRPHGQRPSSMVCVCACVFSRRHVPQEIGHERSGSVPTGESGSKLLHRTVSRAGVHPPCKLQCFTCLASPR